MANRLSKIELRKRHAPWFDLSKYQRCKFFGAVDWFEQVASRIDLHRMNSLWGRQTPGLYPESLAKEEAFSKLLNEILSAGIVPRSIISELRTGARDFFPERFATLSLLDIRGCAVRSMTIADLLRVAHACDQDALFEAEQQFHDDRWQLYPERSAGTALSRTIKTCLAPTKTANNLAYLVVDLNQPPSVIAQQLLEVLPQQLSECFYAPAQAEKARNPRYETWRKAQVLAYIDLTFWRRRITDTSLRLRITNELIAEWLELSPDSVRHTTETNAHELMDPYGLAFTALREQAISEARQLENHEA